MKEYLFSVFNNLIKIFYAGRLVMKDPILTSSKGKKDIKKFQFLYFKIKLLRKKPFSFQFKTNILLFGFPLQLILCLNQMKTREK